MILITQTQEDEEKQITEQNLGLGELLVLPPNQFDKPTSNENESMSATPFDTCPKSILNLAVKLMK